MILCNVYVLYSYDACAGTKTDHVAHRQISSGEFLISAYQLQQLVLYQWEIDQEIGWEMSCDSHCMVRTSILQLFCYLLLLISQFL